MRWLLVITFKVSRAYEDFQEDPDLILFALDLLIRQKSRLGVEGDELREIKKFFEKEGLFKLGF
jgi:hypothetical protein